MIVLEGQTIAVWFSCGAASAVAAKITIDKYPQAKIRICNNPVAEEDEDNLRFLNDVSIWLGRPIERVTCRKYPNASAVEVWERERFMSGPAGAPCTKYLKKRARQEWEAENKPDWHVLGFTSEERARHSKFILTERSNVIPVLIDAEITKQDCINALTLAGIDPPRVYRMGYPNANCIGCVKATSATYWNFIRKVSPGVFQERAEQSRNIGAKLVRHKKQRIYLDELPPDAKGRPLKSMNFECGTFCEERV